MGRELISPHQQMLPDCKGSFGEEWVSEVARIMIKFFVSRSESITRLIPATAPGHIGAQESAGRISTS